MSKLLERMRQQRESGIDLGGYRFKLIRPTVEQMVEHKAQGFALLDLAKKYVIGWDGVTEVDIVSGGTTDPAEFDLFVWHEWLADNPDWWEPIGQAALDLFNDYAEKKGDAVKN